MAGRSHWSQSIEADAATASLTFDVACRVQREPRWLGSSYWALHGVWDCPAPERRIARGLRVEFKMEPAADSPPSRIEHAGPSLAIAPDLRTLRFPSTVRWKYRIAVRAATASPSGMGV
jgi:hypothetical protein